MNTCIHMYKYKNKIKIRTRAGDMTQQLRTLPVLAEDPDSVTKLQSQGDPTPTSDLL